MVGPTKFRDVAIAVDGYDTILSSWAWDVISLSSSNNILWQFSKLTTVQPLHLSISYGLIKLQNVPLDINGRLAVLGVDLATMKRFQPVANVAPVGAPTNFLLKAKTAPGSIASQQTNGKNTTGPTYTVSISEAIKAGLKIFGADLESTTTAGGTRTSSSTTKTQQQQTTVTTPTSVVLGLELHRTMHIPDLAMASPANQDAYG